MNIKIPKTIKKDAFYIIRLTNDFYKISITYTDFDYEEALANNTIDTSKLAFTCISIHPDAPQLEVLPKSNIIENEHIGISIMFKNGDTFLAQSNFEAFKKQLDIASEALDEIKRVTNEHFPNTFSN